MLRIRLLPPDGSDDVAWRSLAARASGDGQRGTLDERSSTPVGRLIAEFDGTPAGLALVGIRTSEPHPEVPGVIVESRVAHLHTLWVTPEARRVGGGRGLIAAAARWARFAGARTLVVHPGDGGRSANVLRDTGFVDHGSGRWAMALGPLVMGVVNVTPDSFSDGGHYLEPAAAIDHALALVADGADIIDVGGEATNPRAAAVSAEAELERILPVIERLARDGVTVSVDTTKASVARAAVAAGASIINDVSGGRFDREMPAAVAATTAVYIAGHLRGSSIGEVFGLEEGSGSVRTGSLAITWREVAAELGESIAALPPAARSRVWVDPGLGFGKGSDPETNLALIRHVGDLGRSCGAPVVVGPSRKRFLRRVLAAGRTTVDRSATPQLNPPDDLAALDAASVAACLAAVRAGAHVVRVHNVALLRAALAVYTRM